MTESYRVVAPITPFGLVRDRNPVRIKNNKAVLRSGMEQTLERIQAVIEHRTDPRAGNRPLCTAAPRAR